MLFLQLFPSRSYPVAFGLHVQRILGKLTSSNSGPPAVPTAPEGGWNAPLMFLGMPMTDTWVEAHLVDCCIYVRGSKSLSAPSRWKDVFPTHLPTL